MPDELTTPATAPQVPQQSELDRLMAEAEQAATTPVTDHPKPCQHLALGYHLSDTKKCPTCLWSFCVDCASTLDPQYCRLCLTEPDAAFIQSPLKDEDGVVHEGRELTPDPNARFFQPRFGTLCKTISEMKEHELEDYIKYYRDLVKQAETALDFRRVVLGSSQLELSQRQDAKRRALRADKTKFPVKTLTIAKDGSGKKKTAGVTDLLKMLEMLKQLQKNREAKTAPQAQAKQEGVK